jgi:hypothetical protein
VSKLCRWKEVGNRALREPPVDAISGTVVVSLEADADEFTMSSALTGLQVERFGLRAGRRH